MLLLMDKIYWADKIAKEVKERISKDPEVKGIVKKHGVLVYDEKTPSGEIHIGSGRGFIIHDIITKVLKDLGLKPRFELSSDDMDPMDKPIRELPEYNQYLGVPFRNIPSPVKGYKSYAEYYFKQATDKFKDYGIDVKLETTGGNYDKGIFNDAIKKILDNHDKVKAIFERTYDKPYEKISFNPICEKCGKIGTTVSYAWDKKREVVKYKCEPNAVKWAVGCGYEGEVSPYNGTGKLPWKLEWAAKWPSKNVVVEFAGKDHFAANGSRDIAVMVCKEVLDYTPPYPSSRTEVGQGYEFFNIQGKKMSTSKGLGVGFAKMAERIPPKILRFIIAKTKPRSVIDFDPEREHDILLLYDKYDTDERIYYGVDKVSKDEKRVISRVYELAQIGKIRKTIPPQISLRHASLIAQLSSDNEECIRLLQKSDHIKSKISKADNEYLIERLNSARLWLKEFAHDKYKFTLQDVVSFKVKDILTPKQIDSIRLLVKKLESKKYTNDSLFEEFYTICTESGMKNTEFFETCYQVLIGKNQGPKLATLILSAGVDRIIKILKQI